MVKGQVFCYLVKVKFRRFCQKIIETFNSSGMQDSRSTGDDSWWFDRAKEVVVVRPSTDALTRDSNYIDNVYKRPTFSNEL